jgi:hypothetical protein
MVVVSNEPRKRRRFSGRVLIPNEEIRWFICSSAAALRERGGYSDGFASHGEPPTVPFTAKELGLDEHRGHGIIEHASECHRAWHAIGREHREVLASYYAARVPGCTDAAGMGNLVQAMGMTPAITKASIGRLEYAGAMMLMASRGRKNLVTDAVDAVKVAHEIWQIERGRIEKASDVRWKTGVL